MNVSGKQFIEIVVLKNNVKHLRGRVHKVII